MSSSTIQRRSVLSTLITYLGFAFGALNMLFLFPVIFKTEEFGLTRVVTDFGVLASTFATVGTIPLLLKFNAIYKHYLAPEQRDLTFIATVFGAIGITATTVLLLLLKPWIIHVFGRNNPLFVQFYWTLLPFTIFFFLFLILEAHAWNAGKQVLSNFLKEGAFRILTTVGLLLAMAGWLSFPAFMIFFAFIFFIPVLWLFISLLRQGHLGLHRHLSPVTRRLKGRMASFAAFVFFANLFNVLSVVIDTLFLAGLRNFTQAGIFSVAQFFANILDVPMRATASSAVPVLAGYWHARNYNGIASIYRKSSLNLLLAGFLISGLILLNLRNVLHFMKPEFGVMVLPVTLLLLGKLINLSTGLNSHIIQTSNLWRFDLVSSIAYTLLSVPLNFYLIKHYGINGAAIANLISQLAYNSLRYWFLSYKFGLRPFTRKHGEIILVFILLIGALYILPSGLNHIADSLMRTTIFLFAFIALLHFRRYSNELGGLLKKATSVFGIRI